MDAVTGSLTAPSGRYGFRCAKLGKQPAGKCLGAIRPPRRGRISWVTLPETRLGKNPADARPFLRYHGRRDSKPWSETVHSAIFVAVIPDDVGKWTLYLSNVQGKLRRYRNVRPLAENVWLLDLTASIGALAYLVAMAEEQGITAATLPLADAPKWLPASFDPKPIPGPGGLSPARP